MSLDNPLYETPTYMGSLDDMVSLYSGKRDKHQKISSILCEHLLMSGPMLINDGYLVQQPEFIKLCVEQPQYLEAAIEHGMVKVLSRGQSLTEVIEDSKTKGVIGHQLYSNGKYKKHKNDIEKLEKLFIKHDALLSFPKKDLTAGYLSLIKETAEKMESKNYDCQHKDILAPIIENTIGRIESEGEAARTQHEVITCEKFGYKFRSEEALNDPKVNISMTLANEIYHHNLSLLVSNEMNMPLYCDTNRSGAFDNLLDESYITSNTLKKHHVPFVKAEWLENQPDKLAGLFDHDNCLYSIKRDYLKELFIYMNGLKHDDADLISMKNIYQHALATKLGFDKQLAYHFNRMSLGLAVPAGITSALIGATVAPQIGASMIMATVFLTAASFSIEKSANPWITNRSLNVFFSNAIDVNRLNLKKQITSGQNFCSLPISYERASEFSTSVPSFS